MPASATDRGTGERGHSKPSIWPLPIGHDPAPRASCYLPRGPSHALCNRSSVRSLLRELRYPVVSPWGGAALSRPTRDLAEGRIEVVRTPDTHGLQTRSSPHGFGRAGRVGAPLRLAPSPSPEDSSQPHHYYGNRAYINRPHPAHATPGVRLLATTVSKLCCAPPDYSSPCSETPKRVRLGRAEASLRSVASFWLIPNAEAVRTPRGACATGRDPRTTASDAAAAQATRPIFAVSLMSATSAFSSRSASFLNRTQAPMPAFGSRSTYRSAT